MADSACIPSGAVQPVRAEAPRHAALVRLTHWSSALCLLALLVTGMEIVVSHPRFYWGETGNVLTKPLFQIPIPSSRPSVPTGYRYVLPDQNGWSRALHFQAAWGLVFAGLLYFLWGLFGHFRENLFPAPQERSWKTLAASLGSHLRFRRPTEAEAWSYNVLQKLAYLAVIFVLSPLAIWSGLALSPAFVSAVPESVTLLGGQQSARTIHFFVSLSFLLFLLIHVAMVLRAGFASRMRAMISGRVPETMEHS